MQHPVQPVEHARSPHRRAVVLAVVVPGAAGAVWFALGHPAQGAALVYLAVVALVLALFGVDVPAYLARTVGWVVEAISWLLSTIVGVGLVVVGGLLGLVRRRPLSRQAGGWAAVAGGGSVAVRRTFAPEREAPADDADRSALGSLVRSIPALVGVVALLLVVNLLAGLGWEAVTGSGGKRQPTAPVADVIRFNPDAAVSTDPRIDSPAMAAYPWRQRYFTEMQEAPGGYWPFTEYRPKDYRSTYVNVTDWARRSYQSELPAGTEAPTVWLFGGSTAWGEGQRDGFTIASYLSRIAERDGLPIRIRNYGQRGWTHFQEMILFEQLLAKGPSPDVALFYDGANEIGSQALSVRGVPTHLLVDIYAERLFNSPVAAPGTDGNEPAKPPNALAEAWDAYAAHSAVHKAVRAIDDAVTGTPAGAIERRPAQAVDPTYQDAMSPETWQRALDVYRRGRDLSSFLARRYDVQALYYWQPVNGDAPTEWFRSRLDRPTIDLGDALDGHSDTYLDQAHTNEEGARLVAERMWQTLKPKVAAWHRQHD